MSAIASAVVCAMKFVHEFIHLASAPVSHRGETDWRRFEFLSQLAPLFLFHFRPKCNHQAYR